MIEDKCTICNGEPEKKIYKKDWDDFHKEMMKSWSEIDYYIKSCTDCNETGLESVRLSWNADRLNPEKHQFKIYCDETTPCWHCGELKDKHL